MGKGLGGVAEVGAGGRVELFGQQSDGTGVADEAAEQPFGVVSAAGEDKGLDEQKLQMAKAPSWPGRPSPEAGW